MTKTLRQLQLLSDTLQDARRLQVRAYACMTFGPLYIIDDRIFFGLYHHNRNSLDFPAFCVEATSSLGDELVRGFDDLWHQADKIDYASHLEFTHASEAVRSECNNRSPYLGLFDPVTSLDSTIHNPILAIVRHAATDLNESAIYTGNLEIGINGVGRSAAGSLTALLRRKPWHHVFCSTQRRTLETLKELRFPEEMVTDSEAIRERSVGLLEGYFKPKRRLARDLITNNTGNGQGAETLKMLVDSLGVRLSIDELGSLLGDPYVSPPGGESFAHVYLRVLRFLNDEVIPLLSNGKNVLVCTHEGPMRMFIRALEGYEMNAAANLDIGNCELRKYEYRIHSA